MNNNLSRKSMYGTFNARNELIILFFRVIHLKSLINSFFLNQALEKTFIS